MTDDRGAGGEAGASKPAIIIELTGGRGVKIDAGADPGLLAAVLRALR